MTRRFTLGAAFVMATSAIGPGFLTQTAYYTQQLGASFAAVILLSSVLDLGAQVMIWRTLVASGDRAPVLADRVLPGLGATVTGLVVFGGLAFNIGNVAGAGLGLEALLGLPASVGAALSATFAIGLFLLREAGRAMDRTAQLLGGLMVLLTLAAAVLTAPPVGEALMRSVAPVRLDLLATVTLVGGTVGGYIPYAGGHRLLDAGLRGADAVGAAQRGALQGIGIATVMRTALFLAALGAITQGMPLDPANPAAGIFRGPFGVVGQRIFGLVMWAAAITSVVGSAYTSISFVTARRPSLEGRTPLLVAGFVLLSTVVFLAVGRPVRLLLLAGALNGLVLPVTLGALLLAAARPALQDGVTHPHWLRAAGWVVVAVMTAMGGYTMLEALPKLVQ